MRVLVWLGTAFVMGLGLASGCDCSSDDTQNTTSMTGQGGSGGLFNNGGTGGCSGLECQQVACENGVTTTVSGTVYEPGGTLPLYNVLVYVPNAPLDPLPEGASCDQCGNVSGDPLVADITDTSGRFTLEDVPVGDAIPIVIQVGKWRRELTLDIAECVDNPIVDIEATSLPSNQGEGHIPKIALTTGGADPLECLLRKIGLDDEEFTLSTESGRVNLFEGTDGTSRYDDSMNGGVDFEDAEPFWSSLDTLLSYDVVLMACELAQYLEYKPPEARQAMYDYANAGGRMFLSHWHNAWLEHGPAPWPTTAVWNFLTDPPSPYVALVDQSFPKGAALAEWLVNVNGSTVLGELPINAPQHTVDSVNAAGGVQQWIIGHSQDPSVKYFTFNAPLGAPDDELCGRVVFSDIHVSSDDEVNQPFPTGCTTTDLSPQEKALIFMLFDLSACINPDDEPPPPPIE